MRVVGRRALQCAARKSAGNDLNSLPATSLLRVLFNHAMNYRKSEGYEGSMPAVVASLWIGESLGEIEIACLRSFHRLGHPFILYTYSEIRNVPDFVELRDASQIFPTRRILRHWKNGSPAIHSDLFRYALMAKTDFIWVDLDVIALREFAFPKDFVFGWESSDVVANGVLRLPKNSPALKELLKLDETTTGVPPFLTGLRQLKYEIRDKLSGGLGIERWPWGATGPRLLTECLKTSGEIENALPVHAFYSVPLSEAWKFCVPASFSREQAPNDAYAVHVWANKLRPYVTEKYHGKFPKDSFVMMEATQDA